MTTPTASSAATGMPARTKQAIDRYVQTHTHVGNFLTAVLSNDLARSLSTADDENREALFNIVRYCWNEIPGSCWGSPEKVRAWIDEKGAK